MDILNLAIIFFVAMAGGSVGSLIGGTSILTIPTLILLGLPPHTAAFPGISTGFYGYPAEEAAYVAFGEVLRHEGEFPSRILMVAFGGSAAGLYRRVLRELTG